MNTKILTLIFGMMVHISAFSKDALKTVFGTLSINEEKVLFIDGKRTTPVVQGDFGLTFEKTLQYGDKVAVLVANNSGGTNCPVLFRWIILERRKVNISDEFGSCSDIVEVSIKNNVLITEFPKLRSAGTQTFVYDGSNVSEKQISTTLGLRGQAEEQKDNKDKIRNWAKKNTLGFVCGRIEDNLSKNQLINDFFKGGRCSRAGQATLTIACAWSHRIVLTRNDGEMKWQIAPWMNEISINPTSDKWVHFDMVGNNTSRVAQSVDGVTERELHTKDGMLYEKKGKMKVVTFKCYDFKVGDQ